MSVVSFSFENSAVRTLGSPEAPLFVALDVCNALQHSNPWKAVKDLCDDEDVSKQEIVDAKGRKQTVNCVNESGLYALIFGSKLESAKRFKRWVTSEVLPAIRKTGRYECKPETEHLTEEHAYQIMAAVARRAKSVGAHYQTIYRALKARYQVTKYTHIRDADFEDAMRFIQTVDLRVPTAPESPFDETGRCKLCGLQPLPKDCIVLTPLDINRLMNWIYCWRYLFRESLELFDQFLHAVGSPYSAQFHEMIVDSWMGFMESMLRKNGYEIRAMKCYQAFIANK